MPLIFKTFPDPSQLFE
eukprot:Gb_20776 [translate_table: standard]